MRVQGFEWSDALARTLEQHLPGAAPGGQVAAIGPRGAWHAHSGHVSGRGSALVDDRTVFDLASVTKPVLALGVARAVRRGWFEWRTPLADLLPSVGDSPAGRASVAALLSHRAGLAAHIELFAGEPTPLTPMDDPSRVRALRVAATSLRPQVTDPNSEPLYSDLGYLLVGAAMMKAGADPLDEYLDAEVSQPLGLGCGSARLLGLPTTNTAPTERTARRGGLVCGAVHDENAWVLAGSGIAGHAGLFGTAKDLARLGDALLDAQRGHRPDWLDADELAVLLRTRPGGTLRLGFDGITPGASSAGSRCSPDTFGHLGFTGTSLWCDPRAGAVVALVTNRVHPTRENTQIRRIRPLIHDAAWGAVLG